MKIHISGVCGTATASLAGLLKAKGHQVTGSDQDVYPPMSDELFRMGVPVSSPYAESNIPADAELVVIGNALSRGNPEVEAVLDAKRRYTSQAALLADEFLRDRTSIVVAGTHGKTTTTSMLAHVLKHAGFDPSFLIGGVSLDLGTSYGLGSGRHFVVEGDEYDTAFFDKRPKFVHYLPDVAVIGNLEFDHADIYADLAAVQLAFTRLMSVIPRRGLLIAGIESPGLALILGRAKSRVATFALGETAGASWQARGVVLSAAGAGFDVFHDGECHGRIAMSASGNHNVRNALAATIAALEAGVPFERIVAAFAAFRGVKRRLEVRGEVRGITVYDDFAHHPTAVRETIAALRSRIGPAERVVTIFEPRSYTSPDEGLRDGLRARLRDRRRSRDLGRPPARKGSGGPEDQRGDSGGLDQPGRGAGALHPHGRRDRERPPGPASSRRPCPGALERGLRRHSREAPDRPALLILNSLTAQPPSNCGMTVAIKSVGDRPRAD